MKIFNILLVVFMYSNLAGAAMDANEFKRKEVTFLYEGSRNEIAKGVLGEMINIDGTEFLIKEEDIKKIGERIDGYDYGFSWIAITSYDEAHGACSFVKGNKLNDLISNLHNLLEDPNDECLKKVNELSEELGHIMRGHKPPKVANQTIKELQGLIRKLLFVDNDNDNLKKTLKRMGLLEESKEITFSNTSSVYIPLLKTSLVKLEAAILLKDLVFKGNPISIVNSYPISIRIGIKDKKTFFITFLNDFILRADSDNQCPMPSNPNPSEEEVLKLINLQETGESQIVSGTPINMVINGTNVEYKLDRDTILEGLIHHFIVDGWWIGISNILKWLNDNLEFIDIMIDKKAKGSEKYKALAMTAYFLIGEEGLGRGKAWRRFEDKKPWPMEKFKEEMEPLIAAIMQIFNKLEDKKTIFREALNGIIDFNESDAKIKANLQKAGLID